MKSNNTQMVTSLMSNEKILFILLIGMLIYKALDLWANKLKMMQTTMRLRRITDNQDFDRRTLKTIYRRVRAQKLSEALCRTIVTWITRMIFIKDNFDEIVMGLLFVVIVVLVVGGSLPEVKAYQSVIVGISTFCVSVVSSGMSVLIEKAREMLERL